MVAAAASYGPVESTCRPRSAEPEVYVDDGTQYSGKEAPNGEQRDGKKPIGDPEQEKREHPEEPDRDDTRKEAADACRGQVEQHHRDLVEMRRDVHDVRCCFAQHVEKEHAALHRVDVVPPRVAPGRIGIERCVRLSLMGATLAAFVAVTGDD